VSDSKTDTGLKMKLLIAARLSILKVIVETTNAYII